ncbi:SdpA family antimicrobial peptide system protein [Flavobacterium psychrophilum]|uniref:SdpA family antimicrobial peptide system protein n=2 Tax=Flavobacterium psychrophilum TaxID=96345 RepID=UPI000B8EC4CC|nr:SdpA family antimicrobial peptide system protein [Flavobacterium psychrophilum]
MNIARFKLMFFYGSFLSTIFIVFYITVISVSPNTITLNYNVPFKSEMNVLAPQGWAFFTKDVHKDYFKIYEIKNKKTSPVSIKSAEFSQYLGIKRENRVINFKIQTVIDNVDSKLWYNFKGNINELKLDSVSKISIIIEKPMIYGTYLIEKGVPLPYEWYRLNPNTKKQWIISK